MSVYVHRIVYIMILAGWKVFGDVDYTHINRNLHALH